MAESPQVPSTAPTVEDGSPVSHGAGASGGVDESMAGDRGGNHVEEEDVGAPPPDPLDQVFDVIIMGTGMVESIVSGCVPM